MKDNINNMLSEVIRVRKRAKYEVSHPWYRPVILGTLSGFLIIIVCAVILTLVISKEKANMESALLWGIIAWLTASFTASWTVGRLCGEHFVTQLTAAGACYVVVLCASCAIFDGISCSAWYYLIATVAGAFAGVWITGTRARKQQTRHKRTRFR